MKENSWKSKKSNGKTQEYYLNEQLKAIQKNLERLTQKEKMSQPLIESNINAKMPKLARAKCLSELKTKINDPMSIEQQ